MWNTTLRNTHTHISYNNILYTILYIPVHIYACIHVPINLVYQTNQRVSLHIVNS